MRWYWRDGTLALDGHLVAIENPEWLERMRLIEARLCDMNYRVVRQERLANGCLISTVWLGLDHNHFRNGPPLIFETMVFAPEGSHHHPDAVERYSTEAEAIEGHEAMKREMEKHQWS